MSLPARGDVTASDWDDRLAAVFADPSLLRLVFQPMVDLQRGAIAGYETLARFSTPGGRSEHPRRHPDRLNPDRLRGPDPECRVGASMHVGTSRPCLAERRGMAQ